ncbi:hypothetical protein RhiirA5_365511 [Rhizophagus irregularis]|nr:hypothetical protein RhiirA5_365511 [Rhizophagus irregularis]PKY31821.1 hypothetical protein RhiirB3_419769 [Rhizophagus irregularis]
MELLGDLFENEQRIGNSIRNVPTTLQRNERKGKGTMDSKLETGNFDNGNRRSDDPSCHSMGCSYPLLYDQHLRTSNADFSRLSDGMAVSTFKTVVEVDNDFRASDIHGYNRYTTMADSIKCGVEIKRQGNHEGLVRSVANRGQEFQKKNNKVSAESRFRDSPSLSSGRSWEFGKESSTLAVRELCRDEYMVPSSVTDTRATNQNLCNDNRNTRNEIMLRELPNDDGMQNMRNTNDLASLIKLLKDKEPYREETNKDVFTKSEIYRFPKTYGITDFRLVFACGDSVFWLEDHGVIYFWSRIDDSMIRGGGNLEEALKNYLFNQEKLCYVDEITRELVPINAYDKEAEEWVNSIDVTKIS